MAAHLTRHDFKALFIEVLGWDHAAAEYRFEADGLPFIFRMIAHKRGFQVLICETDPYTLFNRSRLRQLERRVLRVAHEHIVIYVCNEPRKQVWQWAVRLPGGNRLRHREHGFVSLCPPPELLNRLCGLRFTLHEEEHVVLTDALARTRAALDTKSEKSAFVRRPAYAERGDGLARLMIAGNNADFHAFVLFHIKLAAWGSKRLKRHALIDDDDAVQICAVALIRAARKFDPKRGYQFSTYATNAIIKQCFRTGPWQIPRMRVPLRLANVARPLLSTTERLAARRGAESGLRFQASRMRKDRPLAASVAAYLNIRNIASLNDRSSAVARHVRMAADPYGTAATALEREDLHQAVERTFRSITPEDAMLLRHRFGYDATVRTLRDIGNEQGLTKERVRQKQLVAEKRFREQLLIYLGDASQRKPKQLTSDLPFSPAKLSRGEGTPAEERVVTPLDSPCSSSTYETKHMPYQLKPYSEIVQGELFAHAH